jgi:imidazolonepropionase-like amidohydrolase
MEWYLSHRSSIATTREDDRLADLVLRSVRVLDERGGFSEPVDVAAREGLVTAVGRNLPPELGGRDIDARGLWLMPGVFDCHVHVGLASFDESEAARTPSSLRILETAQALRRTLLSGVTFVREAGTVDAGVRDAVSRGYIPGPALQVCVAALGPGRATTGAPPAPGQTEGEVGPTSGEDDGDRVPDEPGGPGLVLRRVRGADQMRRAVRRLLDAGADWIKLMATGGVFDADDEAYSAEMQEPEIAAAVTEAARRGKAVMVHAHGGPAIGAAVRAGGRSLEHGLLLTEEDADLMARRGCALVPTLAIYHELAGMAAAGTLPVAAAKRMDQLTPRIGEAVAIAKAAGVPIALGTDFGHRDQHGRNLVEILHLRRAGLTAAEALLAATATGANLCGVGDRLGHIAPGYVFDALLLDDDPGDLECFARVETVTGVFRHGVPVLSHPRLLE